MDPVGKPGQMKGAALVTSEGADPDGSTLKETGRSTSRPHWAARGCLAGVAVALVLTFVWWQILGKIWTDCEGSVGFVQGVGLIVGAPLVFGSTWIGFGVPVASLGRSHPRAASVIGLGLAVAIAYAWLVYALPTDNSAPFHQNPPNRCPGSVPVWWPSWLPL